MSKIKIVRPWAYFGFVRALRVNIDGVSVGGVDSRKTEEFDLAPGVHTIQVSMDWCKSPPLSVEISDNDLISLTVKTESALIAGLFCFIRPSKVFSLVKTEVE